MMDTPQFVASLVVNTGMAGLMLVYIVKRLDKITEGQAALTHLYTILITSLPDTKKRAREDAESIDKRLHDADK